jgi:hypothetical protein
MTFYKVIQDGGALAIRLSPINQEKKFFPKYRVDSQELDYDVAIQSVVPKDTFGLFLKERFIYRIPKGKEVPADIPCVELLVGGIKLIIPTQSVSVLSEKELGEMPVDENE